jgi:hypothetical protein
VVATIGMWPLLIALVARNDQDFPSGRSVRPRQDGDGRAGANLFLSARIAIALMKGRKDAMAFHTRDVTVFLLVFAAIGCADTDTKERTLPGLETLAAGWNEITPGGGAVCARGEPLSFFVRPGTVNKLVVDFFGGGACWDAVTCAEDSSTFYFFDMEAIRRTSPSPIE